LKNRDKTKNRIKSENQKPAGTTEKQRKIKKETEVQRSTNKETSLANIRVTKHLPLQCAFK
jgi:hypothetical protein